eukprot:Phypoly_transcript_11136.p1 GENE.Phypoly_transcript_11136~~Phypoly_transcript_11136.p1  ORF type:complete len:355 (+),score=27.71 Phypoly_transcript_11136:49-1065(+)
MKMIKSRSARLSIQLGFTFIFFLVELIVGNLVNSLALVSDSFHMLSDILAMGIALYAIRVAKRDSSEHMSYGWVRAEIVGAFANAIFLIGLCFTIIIDAIQRFFEPEKIKDTLLLLVVGGAGLLINIIGLVFFHEAGGGHGHSHGHSHGHGHAHGHGHGKGKHVEHKHEQEELEVTTNVSKNQNMNMQGVFLHLLGDALGSVAVIVVGLVLHFAPNFKGGHYLDPALSLVIVAILLAGCVPLSWRTATVLLHRVPPAVDLESLRNEIKKVEGVLNLHEIHIWQLSDSVFVGSCHLIVDPDADQVTIITTIKSILHRHEMQTKFYHYNYKIHFTQARYS